MVNNGIKTENNRIVLCKVLQKAMQKLKGEHSSLSCMCPCCGQQSVYSVKRNMTVIIRQNHRIFRSGCNCAKAVLTDHYFHGVLSEFRFAKYVVLIYSHS